MSITQTLYSCVTDHALLLVTSVVVSYYVLHHLFDAKRRNLPPGPSGIPILGYIPFLPSDYGSKVRELFQQYGKIFSVRLGPTDVVFISDFEVIKKITMQDVFNCRPKDSFVAQILGSSLACWNGEEWKEQRKFSLRVMRHLGIGKQEVEDAILDEIEDLIRRVELKGNKPMDVQRQMGSSVSNVITLLITGQRLDHDHPTRVMIDDCVLPRGTDVRPNILGPLFYLPIITKIALFFPIPVLVGFQKKTAKVFQFMKDCIEDRRKTFDTNDGNATCFIEAYLKEMAENKQGKYFDDQHLMGCAFTFFAAGVSTTGDFLVWFTLYMMVHPVVQRKMRKEIDEVIGSKRVSVKYRDAMPYTEAVIHELHRIVSVLPCGITHAVGADVELEGYFLPKETHVILYTYGVHMDPNYFEQPEEFIPERFISQEGKFVRDERVIPFGYGKRSCPGEPIANTEIFLYITSFLQKFEIEMPRGKKYTTRGEMEFAGRIPIDNPVEVLFKRR